MLLKKVLCLTVIIAFAYPALSQEKRIATAYRIQDEPPFIDGLANDEAWQAVEWHDNFVQWKPYEGAPPSQKTEYKILYDDNSIYVAIRAWDTSPDSIVTRLSRRDSGDGDAVGIEFDSYYDHQNAFSFIVFASGVKVDKFISGDGGSEDLGWDAIWDAKTSIDNKGWVAELEIPLNQLRFNNTPEQQWGLQVGRYIHRKDENSLWQPIPRDASGWVHQFGVLNGIEGIRPKRQVEIAPYLLGQFEKFEPVDGNPFATGKAKSFSGGLDTKIGLTNDITLDLTVFPDFGQVEADPSEVNLSAYETYFPEKRPFFIEGRNLFNFKFSGGDGDHSAENLFYSRRIGRRPSGDPNLNDDEYSKIPDNTAILGAAKVTGKNRNGLSFGIMEAVTAREFAKVGTNGSHRVEEVEPLTNYLVGSLIKDYNEGNTRIGALLTSTNRDIRTDELDFLHAEAYSGGINFLHHWNNKNYYINAKSYFSHVSGSTEAILRTQQSSSRYFQRPDAEHVSVDSNRTSLTGHGGFINIGKGGDGSWRFAGFLSWKSPELEVNDIGYVRVVDDISQGIWIGYRVYEPFSIFRSLSVNINQWTGHNFAGERGYWGTNINLNTQLKNYWNGGMGINYQGESLSFSALRGGSALVLPEGWNGWIWGGTDSRKKVRGSLFTNYSKSLFAESNGIDIGLTYKPNDALVVTAGPYFSWSTKKIQFVDNIEVDGEFRYINASIDQRSYTMQIKADYSITPDLSIQFYGRPFFAKGKYFDFKKITDPRADKFNERFYTFTDSEISFNSNDDVYSIDDTGNGLTDYSFENPNFNIRSFQSNLVVRWEYRPGSILFLVWSQGRDSFESDYSVSLNHSARKLYEVYPHNIFLMKLAYRFY